MKILIVDDIKENLQMLELLLRGYGYEVESAADGVEALERISGDNFQMIISDILMPRMDGFQLCREVKKNRKLKEIAFVFYTATYTDTRDEEFAMSLGAEKFIVKPTEPDEFMEILKEVIKKHEMGALKALKAPIKDETVYLKEYNERLVRKLEDKMLDLEKVNTGLRESEGKYRDLIDNANDAVIVFEKTGYISFVNPKFCKITGYSIDEAKKLHFNKLIHPDDLDMCSEYFRKRQAGEKVPKNYELRLLSKAGKTVYIDNNASALKKEGRITGVLTIMRDITERKRAEKALQKASEKRKELEAIVNNSPAVVFLWRAAEGWPVEFVSDNVQQFGYAPEDFYSGRILFASIVHPDDRERVAGEITMYTQEGRRDFIQEYRIITKSGEIRVLDDRTWVRHDANGIITHYQGIVLDITKRKRAEEKIKEYSRNLERMVKERTGELNKALTSAEQARDRIDGIIKSIADGLIVTDIYNRVILMNRASEEMLGVQFSDVIDRPIDFAIREETLREKVKYTLDKKTPRYQFDFELPGPDPGHPRTMRAITSVIEDKKGRQTGIVMIIHDVTRERKVDRIKTEFISTTAHELRTPLTSIRGFSEILLTRNNISKEESKKFLSYINKQAVNLSLIISDLLNISRIESGLGFSLNKVKCSAGKTIESLISDYQTMSPRHRFDVVLPDKSVELFIDKEKIGQVLTNILDNAINYSPKGGRIRVVGEAVGSDFRVSVEDQGIGMTPEQVDKMFGKFYRADTSDSAPEGTGLGMTIVKYIIEAHGGKVWVESVAGKGTRTRFTIPLGAEQQKEQHDEKDSHSR